MASGVLGQESISTTVLKPVLPDLVPGNPSVKSGVTYVAIDTELERIHKGDEPRTLDELRAMERQQAKLAAKINEVTVNVQQGSAQGSGVIVTPEGYIFTAAHVAGKPGREASVLLASGRRVKAITLGMNRAMDAGLLQITTKSDKPWPYATLGRSSSLKLGQWVIASGHPGGWMSDRPSVIRIGRVLGREKSTLITDCALIGGDSGGPLFDFSGSLIGIHSRIGTETADNMHVPIDVYRDSWQRLANSESWGTLPGFEPVIGVIGRTGSNTKGPAEVASVVPDSPAEHMGLAAGDIIFSFDGRTIKTFQDLMDAVQETLPGDLVEVRFRRKDVEYRKSLRVGVAEP